MNESKDIILKRIEELLESTGHIYSKKVQNTSCDENSYFKSIYGTISILKATYGDNSSAEKTLLSLKDLYIDRGPQFRSTPIFDTVNNLKAILENLKTEIEYGLLTRIENRAVGEIFGDMVSMAKKLFNEGQKEPSSVLACAALEDSLKKYAINNGLDVYESELSQVINALKSKSLLKGPQAALVQSFVTLRNKAFHAQFDKIEMPEIISLIAFIEQFLLQNFQ